VVVLMTFHNYF